MKVTLYMAVSVDGYIAKKNGDSDWVSEIDSRSFKKKAEEIGCIIVGRKTFDQYHNDIYPIEKVMNIVLTNSTKKENKNGEVIFVSSPRKALQVAEQKGYDEALLIGGGHINTAFLKESLINEISLSIHPLILGEGIKIFEEFKETTSLEFVNSKKLEEGLLQVRYKVKK